MYYGKINAVDVANGPGVRVTLFVSGCTNRCPGCFQPETWDFAYGQAFTEETQERLLELLKPAHIEGLTLLGGDPMEPQNQRALLPFLKRVRQLYPGKNIWAYTGFTLELLHTEGAHCRTEITDELLSQLDVLVDGPFIQARKNLMLKFRGSENQRIIDLKSTRETGETVLWNDGK